MKRNERLLSNTGDLKIGEALSRTNEYTSEWNRPINPALIPSMDNKIGFIGEELINYIPARCKGKTFATLMFEHMKLMDDENVRILPTSKTSGYYGVDVYVPSPEEERVGQPLTRLQGTMSIKDETYMGALRKGIEFYKEYKLNNEVLK